LIKKRAKDNTFLHLRDKEKITSQNVAFIIFSSLILTKLIFMEVSNALPLIMMILVGALAGTLAARIMKGDSFGFAINALLGIGGGVIGGILFDFLGFQPGSNVVRVLNDSYGLTLGGSFIGQLISATVGAVIILFIARFLKGGRR